MKRGAISRRRFALITGTAGIVPLGLGMARGRRGRRTTLAAAVVRRIQAGTWRRLAFDRSGRLQGRRSSTVVKGIATTAMATMDVLKQAVKANANLVLTYEPTFYSRADVAGPAIRHQRRDRAEARLRRQTIRSSKQSANSSRRTAWLYFACATTGRLAKRTIWSPALPSALGWSAHAVKSDDALYDIPPATAEEQWR